MKKGYSVSITLHVGAFFPDKESAMRHVLQVGRISDFRKASVRNPSGPSSDQRAARNFMEGKYDSTSFFIDAAAPDLEGDKLLVTILPTNSEPTAPERVKLVDEGL